MSVLRRTVVALPAAAALLIAVPNTVFAAHDQPLFTWSGTVDREVFIVVRGRDVNTQGRDANLPNRVRVANALPRGYGELRVNVEEGRGNIGVIEQPSARNGWQAVIRVQDPSGGADRYRLSAYWDDGDSRNGDGRGNGNGRGNGDWNRDRDDRGRDDRGRGNGDWDDRGRDDRGRDDRGRDDRFADHGVLKWSGRVDDLVEIRIQGRRVDYITRSGARVSRVNADFDGAGLPRRMVDVQVVRREGRGEVDVVQQPNARNDYTAVIRVYDPRGGASDYDLVARW